MSLQWKKFRKYKMFISLSDINIFKSHLNNLTELISSKWSLENRSCIILYHVIIGYKWKRKSDMSLFALCVLNLTLIYCSREGINFQIRPGEMWMFFSYGPKFHSTPNIKKNILKTEIHTKFRNPFVCTTHASVCDFIISAVTTHLYLTPEWTL